MSAVGWIGIGMAIWVVICIAATLFMKIGPQSDERLKREQRL